MEPRNVKEAMTDTTWIDSMQEELLQFKMLNVWVLVPPPSNKTLFIENGSFKHKQEEREHGHQKQDSSSYERFTVFQIDVKIDFLHGSLKEGMYVCQPKGFIDTDHPSHVYKLKKAIYGLKQASRAWYDELSKFLKHNHFNKGTIDPTLFIRRFDDDILVVQFYVDDIFFGFTNPSNQSPVESQKPCGIFINQSNYVLEILKKYGMETCDPVGTLMEIKDKFDLDKNGTLVDAMKYRSMIGALMYLTSSRPNIVHATCLCVRYQAKTTEKHLKKVKRILCYLQGTVNMDLWYTKDFGFELTGFLEANYAGCKDTFKSTSGET
ncbi:retrovirus-related pol polyprotein from transposon TNT 1-94 [Tanacetum coccineum]